MKCTKPYTASCLTNIAVNLKPVFTMQRKELITEKTYGVTDFMRHLKEQIDLKGKA